MHGCWTFNAAAIATQASAAFPPDSRTRDPIVEVIGSLDTHTPFLLNTGDLRLFQLSIVQFSRSACPVVNQFFVLTRFFFPTCQNLLEVNEFQPSRLLQVLATDTLSPKEILCWTMFSPHIAIRKLITDTG
jgi:hypothetical protein